MSDINFIFAEFGADRKNTGGADVLSYDRLNPALSEFREYFPNAKYTVYTDLPKTKFKYKDVEFRHITPVFDSSRKRYGWECNDFYKVYALCNSDSRIAIALDTDIVPVKSEVVRLPDFIKRFGMVAPLNPRLMVRKDNNIGGGGRVSLDCDLGIVTNSVPLGFDTKSDRHRCLLKAYLDLFAKSPARLPTLLAKTMWETGIYPYVLPPQWCVCQEHVTIETPIILHIGHPKVYKLWQLVYKS